MDLWIKSQDKNFIVKVEDIKLVNDFLCSDTIQLTHIVSQKYVLGSYAPQRAKEIFNDITRKICCDYNGIYEMPQR